MDCWDCWARETAGVTLALKTMVSVERDGVWRSNGWVLRQHVAAISGDSTLRREMEETLFHQFDLHLSPFSTAPSV